MRAGTEGTVEHGLGAAQAIGSLRRERPLTRRGMSVPAEAMSVRPLQNKVVTRFSVVLVSVFGYRDFFVGRYEIGTHH